MPLTTRRKKSVLTPLQQVWLRLYRNKPALAGLLVVLGCLLLTTLGYLVMPDDTPYANDGSVEIQKQAPGFRVQMLRLRKGHEVPRVSWPERMLFGQASPYTLVPITRYRIDGLTVWVKPFRRNSEESYSIPKAVLPLFPGHSRHFPDVGNFRINGEQITYLDTQERVRTISRAELLRRFRTHHLQTRRYWLGTDKAGRDMLSRLLYGVRISLGIGFMAVCISMIVGSTMGALAGFFGGVTDRLVSWLMTVVWSVPSIMLVIAVSMAFGSRSIWVAFVAVGLTLWVDVARVVRGQIMGLKEKQYIEAARSMGLPPLRLIRRHLLPNMAGPLLVILASNFATAILTEAGLSFLGLGVQPPMPSWGSMIQEGFHALGSRGSWHLVLFPSLCICTLVLAFNLLSSGLRDAFDPHTFLE